MKKGHTDDVGTSTEPGKALLRNKYLLRGVPYVGPSRVCLHIFVVELYSFSLNCKENKYKFVAKRKSRNLFNKPFSI